MSAQSAWTAIHQSTADLLDWLNQAFPLTSQELICVTIDTAPPLNLRQYIPSVTDELATRGFSSTIADRLSDNYQWHLERVADRLQADFDTLWTELSRTKSTASAVPVSDGRQGLQKLHVQQFQEAAASARSALLHLLEDRARHTAKAQVEEAGEYTELTMELLDEAWDRNQKPGQGDRKKLAAVTGLSMAQIGQWFNNRRQRHNKPYSRSSKPRSRTAAARPTPRKVSSTSSSNLSSSDSSTPSINLGSSTSSRRSSGEWDTSPAQSFAVPPASFDSSSIDRYLEGIRTPSPSPNNGQTIDFLSPYISNDPQASNASFTAPFMTDNLGLNLQDFSTYFPSQPPFSFTEPTPQATQTSFEPVNLDLPYSSLNTSALESDIAAGIDEDFWRRVLEVAGHTETDKGMNGTAAQDNALQSWSIAPAAPDADWSFFGDMDFSAFGLAAPQI